VRGVEGGVIPSLRQKGLMVSYQGLIEQDRVDINPKSLGIDQDLRAIHTTGVNQMCINWWIRFVDIAQNRVCGPAS
jgi:hypothetical protein